MRQLLWQPSQARVSGSHMYRFMQRINERHGQQLRDYEALYAWSIAHIPEFWSEFWDYAEIKSARPYSQVIDSLERIPGAEWFEGARLNFAEHLLRHRDDHIALIFKGETRPCTRLSYRQLYGQVARLAAALKAAGVGPGDRIAGFMPNLPEAVVAMLAAASLGAMWSSCSPDFGKKGVLDRFGQIRPKVLFSADGYFYKGRRIDSLALTEEIVREIPSIERLIVVPYIEPTPAIGQIPQAVLYPDFTATATEPELHFEQLPFGHPLYIMYSSGTTGLPKCMVQSAGGILLNQLKELLLHTDLKREDVIFYFTTCGWMMWNWLVCALATGATVVLYDGNPFHPDPGALWQLAQDEGISVFGTSAGYLAALQHAGVKPGRDYRLDRLRTILSTGSPLAPEGFDYVYRDIKADVQLASISGGTDLNGCFVLGNPLDPVYRGEIQCRGLAMRVEAYDEQGRPVIDREGELVCTAPFPSMPIHFWDDPDGTKYRHAYFDVYPGVWRHGDFIEITRHGSAIIHGRSDATLNPGGVRIGTADIYRLVEGMAEITDCIAVGQRWKDDTRIVLFVKLNEGYAFTDDLKQRIRDTLRREASPRHVPAKILAVADIPYTLNMKKVELAVRKTIHGEAVPNRDSLRNPEALEHYRDLPELMEE